MTDTHERYMLSLALADRIFRRTCTVEEAKELLNCGAEPNIADGKGRTPLVRIALEYAALESGSESHLRDRRTGTWYPQTPEERSEERLRINGIIELLLAHGADVSVRDNAGKSVHDLLSPYEHRFWPSALLDKSKGH
mgnify:CR=1 FL=1